MADDQEKRIETLEAVLFGPGGEVQEEAEMRARVYDSFRRHEIEGVPKPALSDEEEAHWSQLVMYLGIARRVASFAWPVGGQG